MKLMIDIPEESYNDIKEIGLCPHDEEYRSIISNAIRNGTPIPDNATNGDMIKLLFPKIDKYNNMLLEEHRTNVLFDDRWWNAHYNRGEMNG